MADAASTLDAAGVPPVAIIAGVGVAAIAAIAFSGGGAVAEAPSTTAAEKEAEPEPIDVSIPYDAAAVLTYCQLKGVSSVQDSEDFAAFKAQYEDAAVAQVTLKKMQREVATMEATVAAKQKALEGAKM